jgi:hypothetical protein
VPADLRDHWRALYGAESGSAREGPPDRCLPQGGGGIRDLGAEQARELSRCPACRCTPGRCRVCRLIPTRAALAPEDSQKAVDGRSANAAYRYRIEAWVAHAPRKRRFRPVRTAGVQLGLTDLRNVGPAGSSPAGLFRPVLRL